jgi:lipid-binding SYLF domain-containing protein
MSIARRLPFVFCLLFLALPAAAQGEQQGLVDKSRVMLESLLNDPNMSGMRAQLKRAKGTLLVPQFLKGGFIIGAAGGSGVLLGRDPKNGEWTDPAFVTMAEGSIGLQIGAQAAEVVLLIMTQKGVEAVLSNSFKLGADVSVAVGPAGGGAEASTTANLRADILAFSRTQGLFAGLSLEGAVIGARDEWNKAYYGKPVTATDIIVRREARNPGANPLRQLLAKSG